LIYLPDTNIIIAGLNGDPVVLRKLDELEPQESVLCAPVLAELEYGAKASLRTEENLLRIHLLASQMRFEPFGRAAARRFGATKSNLRRKGITKTDFDLAIAAIALEIGATVVSEDRAFHDGSIAGLASENWLHAAS
jgi:tRNA(fMet)-specific endonuclease VapC